MKIVTRFPAKLFSAVLASLLLGVFVSSSVHATIFETFITGEDGSDHVIFRALFDPEVADSAVVTVAVKEARAGYRLDGIDFMPGTIDRVVVGAQISSPAGPDSGALTHYNVRTGATIAPDILPSTNALTGPALSPGSSKPSTVFTTDTHIYYVENQFGFAGPATHRIMRKELGGAGAEEVVYDGGLFGHVNFEGIEIVGDKLYTFIKDPMSPVPFARALLKIDLDAAGLAVPGPGFGEVHDLSGSPGGDGSDELDLDVTTGLLYGSNIITGEINVFDPTGVLPAGFLIDAATIGASVGDLGLLGTGAIDGIRADGEGHLILSGLTGLLLSVDIAGVLADGADDGDVTVLFDAAARGVAYSFDDLTPLAPTPVPVPGVLFLVGAGLMGLRFMRR